MNLSDDLGAGSDDRVDRQASDPISGFSSGTRGRRGCRDAFRRGRRRENRRHLKTERRLRCSIPDGSLAWPSPAPSRRTPSRSPPPPPESVGMSSERLRASRPSSPREIERNRVPGAVVAHRARGQARLLQGVRLRGQGEGRADAARHDLRARVDDQAHGRGRRAGADRARRACRSEPGSPTTSRRSRTMKVGVPDADGSSRSRRRSGRSSSRTCSATPRASPTAAAPTPAARSRPCSRAAARRRHGDRGRVHRQRDQAAAASTSPARCSSTACRSTCSARCREGHRQALGEHLADTVWKPLGMNDTTFHADATRKRARIAQPFPNNPLDGKPQHDRHASRADDFDCGGGCAIGTVRRLPPLRPDAAQRRQPRRPARAEPGDGAADDQQPPRRRHPEPRRRGRAAPRRLRLRPRRRGAHGSRASRAVPGSPGEYTWNGANGTGFFADPKEQLVVVVRHRRAAATCASTTASRCRTSSTAR